MTALSFWGTSQEEYRGNMLQNHLHKSQQENGHPAIHLKKLPFSSILSPTLHPKEKTSSEDTDIHEEKKCRTI